MGFFSKLLGRESGARPETPPKPLLTREQTAEQSPRTMVDNVYLNGAGALKETTTALGATNAEVARAAGPVPVDIGRLVSEQTAGLRFKSESLWKRFSGALADVRLKMQGLGEFTDELRQTEQEVKKQEAADRAEGKQAFRETLPEAMAQVGRDEANAKYQQTLSRNYGLRGASQVGEKIQTDEDEEAWFKVGKKIDVAAAKEPAADNFADLTDDVAVARAKTREDRQVAKGELYATRVKKQEKKQADKDAPYLRKIFLQPEPAETLPETPKHLGKQSLLGRKITEEEFFREGGDEGLKTPDTAEIDETLSQFIAKTQTETDQRTADEALEEFVQTARAKKPNRRPAAPRQPAEKPKSDESASQAA